MRHCIRDVLPGWVSGAASRSDHGQSFSARSASTSARCSSTGFIPNLFVGELPGQQHAAFFHDHALFREGLRAHFRVHPAEGEVGELVAVRLVDPLCVLSQQLTSTRRSAFVASHAQPSDSIRAGASPLCSDSIMAHKTAFVARVALPPYAFRFRIPARTASSSGTSTRWLPQPSYPFQPELSWVFFTAQDRTRRASSANALFIPAIARSDSQKRVTQVPIPANTLDRFASVHSTSPSVAAS